MRLTYLIQTQGDYLLEFLAVKDAILKSMMARYAPPDNMACTKCSQKTGRWRCRDCTGSDVFCRGCFRRAHEVLPFHDVEFWNGKFYERSSLHIVGARISLEHESGKCKALTKRLEEVDEYQEMLDGKDDQKFKQPLARPTAVATPSITSNDNMPDLEDITDDQLSDYGMDDVADFDDEPDASTLSSVPMEEVLPGEDITHMVRSHYGVGISTELNPQHVTVQSARAEVSRRLPC